MPTYEVEQYEIHVQTYRVEADHEAHAIKQLFDGKIEPVEGGSVFVEIADDLGLPADNYPDLVKALRELGIDTDDVIPSIRDISEVKRPAKSKRR